MSNAQTWNPLEMHGGGKVTGLIFHPTDPNIIFNRTDVAGLNKSTDGGNSWKSFSLNIPKDNPHNFTARNFAIDANNPNTMYYCSGNAPAINGSSIFKTTDGGTTWNRITNPSNFSGNGAYRWSDETLIIHPSQSSKLYVGGQTCFENGNWTASSGFHKSTDGGTSWTAVHAATFEKAWITSVKFHPQNPDLIFISAAIVEENNIATSQKGLWRYNTATGVLDQIHNENVVAFDFDANPNKIILSREEGINVYDLTTEQLSPITKPFNASYDYYLRAHPSQSGRWYFGAYHGFNNNGLVETLDGGANYNQVKYTGGSNFQRLIFPDYADTNFKPGHGNSMAGIYFHPLNPATAFMDGVFKTEDAATSICSQVNPLDFQNNAAWDWTWVAEGIHIMVTLRACPHPIDVEKFVINVADVGEYFTQNGGSDMDYKGLLLHYSASTRYAKSNPDIGYTVGKKFDNTGQLRKTTNGGASWFSPMTTNFFTGSIVLQDLQILDTNPNHVVVGVHQNGLPNQIYRSLNGGSTWEAWDQGITQAGIFKQWESFNRLIKDGNDVFYTFKNDKMYYRSWSDASWTLIPHPAGNTTINQMIVDPSNPGILYMTISNNLIYKWDNGTWSTIPSPTNISDMIAASPNGTLVVIEKLWVSGQRTQKLFVKKPNMNWEPLSFEGFGGVMKSMIFIDDHRLIGISNGQGANMIEISSNNACPKSNNFYAAGIDNQSAKIYWEHASGSDFTLEYKGEHEANWTIIPNPTSPYNIIGLEPCTAYTMRIKVECGNETSEYQNSSFSTTVLSTYCPTDPQSVWRYWIDKVLIGSDNYFSGWNGGYYDWSCEQSTSIIAGEVMSITLTPGFLDDVNNVVWYAWIDLNDDGNWDQSERVISSSPNSTVQQFDIPIDINTSPGNKKMRISMHRYHANTDLGACDVYSNGETEDFVIQVISADCKLVTNTNDSGSGSLREAIDCAENGATISFHPDLAGSTIGITSQVIVINKDLTIDAELSDNITIYGESVGRVFLANVFKNISIKGLYIISGTNNEGGAIWNRGNLTLENVFFYKNPGQDLDATQILNDGTLVVKENVQIKGE
ncbi:GEVED domain-containing protein [Portibacter lacus]|uniref:GEVED domain-containing protein n=1 Tax=Portibacter lacus TaxID=1099794 RepID=A0AA37SQ91_9BACT|nr:GEVED domain-containing protein [Portibacter lacus]GLR17334.1 hypothetical protein GCM10007940_19490 [Portibacter lacus]